MSEIRPDINDDRSRESQPLADSNSPVLYRWLLLVCWSITAVGLWWIWPIQPRQIIEGQYLSFAGITPDNRSLVALTLRAVKRDDETNYPMWSGPIRVFDLRSGRQRSVPFPWQDDSGHLEATHNLNRPDGLIDPDNWRVSYSTAPLQGREFRLVQTNRFNHRWSVRVNLDTGATTRIRLPVDFPTPQWAPYKMSHTGRWLANCQGPRERLQVIDLQSGNVVVDSFGPPNDLCFSPDESLFAFSATDSEDNGSTEIWQLEPARLLRVIDRAMGGMAISPDNHWLADLSEVFEISTGQLAHQISMTNAGGFQDATFTSDGQCLISYSEPHVIYTHPIGRREIAEVHAWNPATGQSTRYRSTDRNYFTDPNPCEDSWLDPSKPMVVGDGKRLIDVQTGQTMFQIPSGATVELCSPDNHIVVLKRAFESRWNRILDQLSNWKVPIPNALRQNDDRSELLICEAPSGRILARLPRDHYQTDHQDLMVSPDGRTLVTTSISSSDEPVIRIWDIPPRGPVLLPMTWGLLAPLTILAWRGLRQRQTSSTPGV